MMAGQRQYYENAFENFIKLL